MDNVENLANLAEILGGVAVVFGGIRTSNSILPFVILVGPVQEKQCSAAG